MTFHNPYHFVPVKEGGSLEDLRREDFVNRKSGRVRHDRFVADTLSGRLICRLETEDPVVLGNEQEDFDSKGKDAKLVKPFTLNGKPAIPSSGLRGCLSSLFEAATNSAMRLLDDRPFSVRADARTEALHHIGMLVQDEGRMKLRPLVIPAFRKNNPVLAKIDQKMFPQTYLNKYAPVRGFVEGYRKNNGRLSVDNRSFLGTTAPDSQHSGNHEYWYAKIAPSLVDARGNITCSLRPASRQPKWILGQQMKGDPIRQSQFDKESGAEQQKYTRGILRVLGINGRQTEMPNKKHEIFIPYPPEAETIPLLEIGDALHRFHRLADERSAAKEGLPFAVKGRAPDSVSCGREKLKGIRLKAGDLVFFRPLQENGSVRVEEIAVSAIWRKDRGMCHEYFADIDPELLPMNPKRQKISLAEQLFGFVENPDKERSKDDPDLLALAGRLRFHDGLPATQQGDDWYLPEVPLRILASPKPPSPALYFSPKQGQSFIAKRELKKENHSPKGRKMYLHPEAKPVENDRVNPPWKTGQIGANGNDPRSKQRLWATPLRAGKIFYFHIDFDNLSKTELGLLLFCLRPAENFRHKIGLGKPIGLGRVRLDPAALLIVNRRDRYGKDNLFSPRYHQVWQNGRDDTDGWRAIPRYKAEAKAMGESLIPADMRKEAEQLLQAKFPDAKDALLALGDPGNILAPVHYPPSKNASTEDKLFEWFMENEKSKKQYLRDLPLKNGGLPCLDDPPHNNLPTECRGGGSPAAEKPASQKVPGGNTPGVAKEEMSTVSQPRAVRKGAIDLEILKARMGGGR